MIPFFEDVKTRIVGILGERNAAASTTVNTTNTMMQYVKGTVNRLNTMAPQAGKKQFRVVELIIPSNTSPSPMTDVLNIAGEGVLYSVSLRAGGTGASSCRLELVIDGITMHHGNTSISFSTPKASTLLDHWLANMSDMNQSRFGSYDYATGVQDANIGPKSGPFCIEFKNTLVVRLQNSSTNLSAYARVVYGY